MASKSLKIWEEAIDNMFNSRDYTIKSVAPININDDLRVWLYGLIVTLTWLLLLYSPWHIKERMGDRVYEY